MKRFNFFMEYHRELSLCNLIHEFLVSIYSEAIFRLLRLIPYKSEDNKKYQVEEKTLFSSFQSFLKT